MVDDVTIAIEDDDGERDTIDLPTGLIDRLAEPGESDATVVTDVALMAFTGRAHALVHHTEDEAGDELEVIESAMLERFEERFGVSYAEATGHAH